MNDATEKRSPNAWLRVATPEPGYADCVVADIGRIVRSKAGRGLIEQIRDSGHDVLIEMPSVPLDPPNAWVQPRDLAGAMNGVGTDCRVFYDPRQWPNAASDAVKSSDILLYNLLLRALDQLRGNAISQRDQDGAAGLTLLGELQDFRT
jgi:hypothetical protein